MRNCTSLIPWLLPLLLIACKPKPVVDGPVADDDDDVVVGDDDDDDDDVGDDDDDDACGGCDDGLTCVEDECVDCEPAASWPSTGDASTIHLVARAESDPSLGLLLSRPFELSGAATVSIGAGLELFDVGGTSVPDGSTLTPGRYLLTAAEEGTSDLTFTPLTGCPSTEATVVSVVVHGDRPIVGRSMALDPFVERVRLFGPGDAVALAVDSVEHADRQGVTGTMVVVADRDAAAWAADPTFGSTVFEQSITLGSDTDVWTSLPTGAGMVGRYDVVLDLDGDGALSPGDLVQGLEGPALGVAGDMSAPGPHAVSEFEWGESYWITQKTYHPTDMSGLDPMPLVLISHGNGHDYRWYNYLGRHLASWGYVVTSHRNDTVPGPLTAAVTTLDNTDAFLQLLPSIEGGVLDGEVDSSRIAWVGHSRGGEGVVLAYDDLVDGNANPSSYGAADIQLISSIAPTIFEGPRQANPNDARFHLMAGSSDGDVTGAPNCDLCQYFRLFKNGTGEAWVTYFQGSTHNDFHDDVQGSFDDGFFVNGVKIGSQRTQTGSRAYFLALLEHVMRGDEILDEYLERPPELLRPQGVDFVLATSAWRSPTRSVIDDFQSEPSTSVSSSGGAVSGDVEALAEGLADDDNTNLSHRPSDPWNGMTWADGDGGDSERVAVFEWQDDRVLDFELTGALTNASGATHLSLRAAQSTRHPLTDQLDGMLSFTVALLDADGNEVGFDTRAWGGIPKPARRSGTGSGSGWVNEFQTLRIPLEAYTAEGRGIDLANLTTVRLRFGPSHGSDAGRLGLDDLAFLTEDAP